MRIKNKIIVAAIVAFCLILILLPLSWFQHNTGVIHLTVNGKSVELDGIEIAMDDDSSDFTGMSFAKTVIHHNTFNMGGIYCWNFFRFSIPQNLLDGYGSDIRINFETLNANEWHHAVHTLDISIASNEAHECHADVTYTKLLPITDINGIRFNEKTAGRVSVILTPKDSSASICDVME